MSALAWGASPPAYVFLHGMGQNAHTFDAVALDLAAPLVSVDLPGHGWSDAASDDMTSLGVVADALADGLDPLLDGPAILVGMSLGGLCAIALATRTPSWWRHVVLLDITPGITPDKAAGVLTFLDGPESFASPEEMVARAQALSPQRSAASLRRGVALNARQRVDGRWVWHHQAHATRLRPMFEAAQLWRDLAALPMPVSLVHGTRADSAVDDTDLRDFRTARPDDTVLAIEGAGHALQSETPTVVADYLASLLP